VRSVIRKATREFEEERTRLVYLKQPHSERDSDDCSNADQPDAALC
jgi:hypothetical protein